MEMWIARDKDGELYLFMSKPYRNKTTFFSENTYADFCKLPEGSYPEVTWKNSPKRVEVKLVEDE